MLGTDLRRIRSCLLLLRTLRSAASHSAQTKERNYSLSGMNARRKDLQCFANSEFESRRIGLWANPRQPQNQQQNLGLIKNALNHELTPGLTALKLIYG